MSSENEVDRDNYYAVLQDLAKKHGENVSDKEAWLSDFDIAIDMGEDPASPEKMFYDEFPQHKPD